MVNRFDKKAQVTIFIIIAILIVGAIIIGVMLWRNNVSSLSKEMQPAYDNYYSCLERRAEQGISLLGEQGGYIYVEDLDFVPGSAYRPFSSQLDFFGQPVPYWMYVSGNNILTTQKPTKQMMEEELERYLEENSDNCNLDTYYSQGYDYYFDEAFADVEIKDNEVEVTLDAPVRIYFEDQSTEISEHELTLNSKLGKFYGYASELYDYEMSSAFLENYAVDVMRLYAPVDGTELTCTPQVFNKQEIEDDLVEALSANVGALKLKGNYYELSDDDKGYFVTDIGQDINEQVNFMYSTRWPTNIEIEGDDVVEPMGLQQGMGILGFCYVHYKFVYDINFPVLVQFMDGDEIFQFPMAVIIQNNQARDPLLTDQPTSYESEVCKYKNQEVEIRTYDLDLNPVEANLRFKCLSSTCDVGETELVSSSDAAFIGSIPKCVNGFILASAEGYADAKKQISSNSETTTSIVMKKKYNLTLDLGTVDSALVSFTTDDYSTTVFYPETKNVELVDGLYNVSVFVYRDTTLNFPGSTETKCVDVPKSGVGGLFGLEDEECYDIELPAMEIESSVVGGGKTQDYVTQSQLKDSSELNINVPLFPTPTSLEELQQNYIAVEDTIIYLSYE